ncbi:MAG: hypothetical protein CR997_13145 [Acidobacteria bacterium]|nr:MAG: hypothetical protein CR997_13145 [Acidobacteriota bacterium]
MFKLAIRSISLLIICVFLAQQALPKQKYEKAKKTKMKVKPTFELTIEEQATNTATPKTRSVAGQPLDSREQEALLQRAPEFKEITNGKKKWTPPKPKGLERPGTETSKPFPPKQSSIEKPEWQPVKESVFVTSCNPQGEVSDVRQIQIRFSQPMIPLQALSEMEPPSGLTCTPQPAGQWRWLGVQTLAFESSSRFPYSTTYEIDLTNQVQSVYGNALKPAHYSFSTPTLRLVNSYYTKGEQQLNPLLCMVFNQKIKPEEIIRHIQIAFRGETLSAEAVDLDSIDQDHTAYRFKEELENGYAVAFKPQSQLPRNTKIAIVLPPGSWSSEGPLPTEKSLEFSFKTYGPLRLEKHRCGYGRKGCTPDQDWTVIFNNPLDSESVQQSDFNIEPAIEGAEIRISDNRIYVRGLKRENTVYTLTIPSTLRDIYGQQLKSKETLTFKVNQGSPYFHAVWNNLIVTLPATQKKSLLIHSVKVSGFQVRIARVNSSDYQAYLTLKKDKSQRAFNAKQAKLPGEELFNGTLKAKGQDGGMQITTIDLTPFTQDTEGYGQFVVLASPEQVDKRSRRRYLLSWVQLSDLGVDVVEDKDRMIFNMYQLSTGKPVKDTIIQSMDGEMGPIHAVESTLKLANTSSGFKDGVTWSAKKGKDELLFSLNGRERGGTDQPLWYVTTDRGLYKPGQEVHFKGILRWQEERPQGTIDLGPFSNSALKWQVRDARGNELATGTTTLTEAGTFDFSCKLPKDADLGRAFLQLEIDAPRELPKKGQRPSGNTQTYRHNHSFQIQEFRTPEYEVTAQTLTPGPYYPNQKLEWAASGAYYAGGGLAEADIEWTFQCRQTTYQPPNWDAYHFGESRTPWWFFNPNADEETLKNVSGKTDFEGKHVVSLSMQLNEPGKACTLSGEATIMDVNRQAWSAEEAILIHPAKLYVGLWLEKAFFNQGETCRGKLIVVDVDGNPVDKVPIHLKLISESSGPVRAEANAIDQIVIEKELISQSEPLPFSLKPSRSGSFKLKLEIQDDQHNVNITKQHIWVFGESQTDLWDPNDEELTLILEKEHYTPGETAKILVRAPFEKGNGVLVVCRSGLVEHRTFQLDGGMTTLEVPLKEANVPNLTARISIVEELLPQPDRIARRSSGSLEIPISRVNRTLNVAITPQLEWMAPAQPGSLSLTVTDNQNQAVENAEVLVMMVDEAVLALTDFILEDPLELFYPERRCLVRESRSDGSIYMSLESFSGNETGSIQKAMAFRGAAALGLDTTPSPDPITSRIDFSPLVFFAPRVRTDEKGQASVSFKLKDNLTRYRVMALAVHGKDKFGTGQANVTARLPLMIRPSAPRFLNFGDRFMLPIVLQNQTERDMPVQLVIRGSNLRFAESLQEVKTDLDGPVQGHSTAGKRLVIPANDRVEVSFASAPLQSGLASFQVLCVTDDDFENHAEDATQITLPVWVPATSEAFATYGEMSADAIKAYQVAKPKNVFEQFGGLDLQVSSTQLQTLMDAYLYLRDYPFDCNEQLASKLIAVSTMNKLLEVYRPGELLTQKPIDLFELVNRILKNQLPGGGFSFWPGSQREWPFATLHVTHALLRAEMSGVQVDRDKLEKALHAVKNIETLFHENMSRQAANSLKAYALYIRALAGEQTAKEASSLWNKENQDLSMEAQAWLLSALAMSEEKDEAPSVFKSLKNKVLETASTAELAKEASYSTYFLLGSETRSNALFLEGLLSLYPESELATKFLRGLLGHRTKGRWNNTQENVWVLLAVKKYADIREKETPDFQLTSWLDDQFAGQDSFKGRSDNWIHREIPISALDHKSQFTLQKEGKGRAYYRLGLSYTPQSLELKAEDQGFSVIREYRGLDHPEDVKQDESGVWHIKAGARVEVCIHFSQISSRQHVALVDPLAAGFEIINPALKTSQQEPSPVNPSKNGFNIWTRRWFQHQNMKDHRAEAFTNRLRAGSQDYRYIVRATNTGVFVVPPAKVEEMYQPETFGRTATDRVVIYQGD